MLLYLIRHGQTDWSKDHRVMGHTPVALVDFTSVPPRVRYVNFMPSKWLMAR